ncbi:MAG: lycopene cyclase family protein [Bacteroidia bacterium]|nr:lycopene cyclase family protein [Bacteroidia bacterium]
MNPDYDFLIAGGGCAGLSLAWRLSQSSLRNRRILILDEAPDAVPDKTWCYWSTGPSLFPAVPEYVWDRMEVCSPRGRYAGALHPYRYRQIRSQDWYRELHAQLRRNPRIRIETARVQAWEDHPEHCTAYTDRGSASARWAFSSLPPAQLPPHPQPIDLLQHFTGWVVETDEPVFDPATARLMDFRTPQPDAVCFVYVLPYSPTQALVEHTVFSPACWPDAAYREALEGYLREVLGIRSFRILSTEQGAIPMTNRRFPRQTGHRLVHTGTAGGCTKATTGYTFLNIQRDSAAMVQSLERSGHPLPQAMSGLRFRFYDQLLLHLMHRSGGSVWEIFDRLFRRNRGPQILRFLDEGSTLPQELAMMVRLPWMPFLQAIGASYPLPSPRRRPAVPATASL